MNGGTRIPLPARLVRNAVCEAMGSAVPEGFRPQRTTPATVAAGTDEPERVAVQGVAADTAVFDTDAATSYRDGVKHDGESVFLSALRNMPPPPGWKKVGDPVGESYWRAMSVAEARERERARRARLSRWQEQR